MNNKILITTSSFNEDLSGLDVVLNPYKRKLTEDEIIELIEKHKPSGIIAGVEPYSAKVLESAKGTLKVISRCGIGLDSIDIDYANQLGIKILNTPDAPTKSVAELTLGLILDVLRGISLSNLKINNGEFLRPKGTLLSNKTVGIIGCGRIGTYLSKLLLPFECKVIGYDKFITKHSSITLVPLDELIQTSDIISLHIPYTEENRHIISKNELEKMKNNTVLINASRGGLVDEEALFEALKEGKIQGAALDCFEKEPYNGKLTTLENVVLTGHIGSYAKEARKQQEQEALKNLLEAL